MLILGREEPEVAGVDSEVAEPAAAFVSEVEVMQHILTEATDTMTRGRFADCRSSRTGCVEVWRRLRATKSANLAADPSECNSNLTVQARAPSLLSSP
jgi:hypothetical protein